MSSESLKLMAIEQSSRQIELSLGELEGVMNRLLQEPAAKAQAQRIQQIHTQITHELQRVRYIVEQQSVPTSQRELQIGQTVQEAIDEISQI